MYYFITNQNFDLKKKIEAEIVEQSPTNWPEFSEHISNKYNINTHLVPKISEQNKIDNLSEELGELMAQQLIDYETFAFDFDDQFTLLVGPEFQNFFLERMFPWMKVSLAVLVTFSFLYYQFLSTFRESKKVRDTLSSTLGINKSETSLKTTLLAAELKSQLSNHEKETILTISNQRELFHGVAHEFRSPLAKIQFALELIEETPKSEEYKLLNRLNKYVDDLDHLIKELLFYSQVNSNNLELETSKEDLHALTQNILDSLTDVYPKVHFKNDTKGVEINVHKELFQRLLCNLLRNAGRFAKQHCEIKVLRDEGSLAIAVEDDGPGIPSDKRTHVFAPFTRLDSSRSRDSGGCGLGLAIVASIAKKHQAHISVANSHLGGAKFVLKLK